MNMNLNKNKITVSMEELKILAKTFPNLTVLDFIELKKRSA